MPTCGIAGKRESRCTRLGGPLTDRIRPFTVCWPITVGLFRRFVGVGRWPLPELGTVTGDPSAYFERLTKYIAEENIALEYYDEIAPAKGSAVPGKITLLPGQARAELCSTCVHELAHCCLHQAARRAETTKRIRETEAEAVAFVVCNAIGLGTETASQDYVGLYGGDAKLLTESLEYVQQTANRILTAIAPENSATPA